VTAWTLPAIGFAMRALSGIPQNFAAAKFIAVGGGRTNGAAL